MNRLRAKIVLVLAALAVSVQASAWCGKGHPTPAQEFNDSGAVIVGKVTAQDAWSHDGEFTDGTLYTVQVTEVLKGAVAETITLYSESSSGRFPMDVGTTYLVFAYRGVFENRATLEWAIDNCGNSTAVQGKQDLLAEVRHLAAAAAQQPVTGGAPARPDRP